MGAIKAVLLSIVGLAVIIGLGWLFVFNDLAMSKIVDPKREEIRRETFEQSKAYRDGMIQELQNMQFEYIKTDSAHKILLASIIRHRAAGIDKNVQTPSKWGVFSFDQPLHIC